MDALQNVTGFHDGEENLCYYSSTAKRKNADLVRELEEALSRRRAAARCVVAVSVFVSASQHRLVVEAIAAAAAPRWWRCHRFCFAPGVGGGDERARGMIGVSNRRSAPQVVRPRRETWTSTPR